MSKLIENQEGMRVLLMGNEAIVRGALEAGVNVATGYPGTPSSEIIENLSKVAKERHLYVEWSTNEKISLESGGRGLLCWTSGHLSHEAERGECGLRFFAPPGRLRGWRWTVLVSCDYPGALSSANEGESRHFARMIQIPLLEPGDFQEAKDMTQWAFELSEEIKNIVMVRSVTRMSHASGIVRLGEASGEKRQG